MSFPSAVNDVWLKATFGQGSAEERLQVVKTTGVRRAALSLRVKQVVTTGSAGGTMSVWVEASNDDGTWMALQVSAHLAPTATGTYFATSIAIDGWQTVRVRYSLVLTGGATGDTVKFLFSSTLAVGL